MSAFKPFEAKDSKKKSLAIEKFKNSKDAAAKPAEGKSSAPFNKFRDSLKKKAAKGC
jgi:hypothetical protein